MQLAQVNVARAVAPMEAPQMRDFVDNLDPINALADAAPGFVWRLQDDDGDATSIRVFDDEMILVNLSVWESVEALADYVYRSAHVAFLRRRKEWFTAVDGPVTALWWVPTGHPPTTEEAKGRLEHLDRHGPTAHAFTFQQPFPPPGSQVGAVPQDDWLCPA